MKQFSGRMQSWIFGFSLIVLTIVVFSGVRNNDFVMYDDPDYVYQNLHVRQGLSVDSVRWALSATSKGNWHPLTWLSHMMDVQMFGLSPIGHHATNVFWHGCGVLLLFVLLKRLTERPWAALFMAAIFAIHPLRVESVAWVAERKDVLSAALGLLTLNLYLWYRTKPGLARYLAVFVTFALGLMAKPMLVSLPIVLLILDWWPLRRTKSTAISSLIIEKLPLFALTAGSVILTVIAQAKGEAIGSIGRFPIGVRLANGAVATVEYIEKLFLPRNLTVIYPHPGTSLPFWIVILSVCILLAISAAVWIQKDRRPYLLAGWLWYIITLLPVIGIVQVGEQALADRYTYIPIIGIVMALTVLVADIIQSRSATLRIASGAMAVAATGILAIVCVHQIRYWKNSGTLFRHALDVTTNNKVAESNYGGWLMMHGQDAKALQHFYTAVRIDPDWDQAWNNVGILELQKGNIPKARRAMLHALKQAPTYSLYVANYGLVVQAEGNKSEAEKLFRQAIEANSSSEAGLRYLGELLYSAGRTDEGLQQFQMLSHYWPENAYAHKMLAYGYLVRGDKATTKEELQKSRQLDPSDPEVYLRLGSINVGEGNSREAIRLFRLGYAKNAEYPPLLNAMAWLLLTSVDNSVRDVNEARRLTHKALRLTRFQNPDILDTFAAILAVEGKYNEAIDFQQRAISLAKKSSLPIGDMDKHLERYRLGKPLDIRN